MPTQVSIIICTRNRAAHLRRTLDAFQSVAVPQQLTAELIIADNGSTDGTAEVVEQVIRQGRLPHLLVQRVWVPTPGQCQARNAGLAAARGEILLFTDDDVRPPANWIAGLCGPILGGEADAVAGGVVIAPHLERAWMTQEHRGWLACTFPQDEPEAKYMIGANMAFSRRVLEKVPGFDLELGPGALGFFDESLFSWQIKEAGFYIAARLDVAVEHHFEPSRLTRQSFLATGEKYGRSLAYVYYHWEQETAPMTLRNYLGPVLKLLLWRAMHLRRRHGTEGISPREVLLTEKYWIVRQFLREQRRPRNYAKRGLRKLTLD